MSTSFPDTPLAEMDLVMHRAQEAFEQFQHVSAREKAAFLEAIATEIEALGESLLQTAAKETNISLPQLTGERNRTTGQLRKFAEMLLEGSWVDASIDTAIPGRVPSPKPDVRKMLVPIGPVVVFGASNFPFAYSTAGGDTASALAAGCSVVVKAHPQHPATSTMVATAITKAIQQCQVPVQVFQHVFGNSAEAGKSLVQHPATAGVGFTGSLAGGRALYDYAAQRTTPIPVFSEMGSVNPVVFLPDTMRKNAEKLALQYAASITLGTGQFCTNPGILIALEGEGLDAFTEHLGKALNGTKPGKMLHQGIYQSFQNKRSDALRQNGVELLQESGTAPGEMEARPTIATVSGAHFLENPLLHEEIFGPYSLLVRCRDMNELQQAWLSLKGQLTTSLMGTKQDFHEHAALVQKAATMAGRIIFNGVPTGVEVCPGMVHGGPYPATTDSRFTAVGIHAVKRWVRPVCWQNCPDELLPAELKNDNPYGIWRLLNNEWTKNKQQ